MYSEFYCDTIMGKACIKKLPDAPEPKSFKQGSTVLWQDVGRQDHIAKLKGGDFLGVNAPTGKGPNSGSGSALASDSAEEK
jgi:hypothetical protein